MTKTARGFTLIELLVVIAIIGLLSSVVLASLNTARAKARDALRISEVKELQTALAFYYIDNGAYPIVPGGGYAEIWSTEATWNTTSILKTALVPKYISKLPVDPKNTGGPSWANGFSYTYSTYSVGGSPILGTQYDLTVRLEMPNSIACPSRSWPILTDPADSWCSYNGSNGYMMADH
jgi:general secretion pathway protein G